MKREHKFKLWHKHTGAFLKVFPYEWKDGVYTNGNPNKFFDNTFEITPDGKECNRIEGKSVFLTIDGMIIGLLPISDSVTKSVDYTDEYEIIEFTGLKDKNGKEIYEGDIIAVDNDENPVIAECIWIPGQFSLKDNADGSWTRQLYHQPERLKVIGNIYENKSLLKTE